MATLGKPAIIAPRAIELRALQQVIANIRERLEAVEGYAAQLQTGSTTTTAAASSSGATGLDRIGAGLVAKIGANVYAARSISAPGEFSISNADGVSGNPTLAWADAGANLVFAGPDGASGQPTFRSLTSDDVTSLFGELLVNPMTDYGDLLFGQSAGSPGRLPIGLEGQFLTVVGGLVEWTTVAPGSGMANPMTDDGDLIFGQSAGSPSRLAVGSEGQVLTVSSGLPQWEDAATGTGFLNPMEDYGDLIVGQSGGGAARLAPGAEGEVLTIESGVPAWAAPAAAGGGMVNPMEDVGDLIWGESAGSPARLPIGAEGEFLQVVTGLPQWAAGPTGGGLANPMDDIGDLIVGQSAGSPARLPVGADDQVLTVVAGVPGWADIPAGGGGFANPMVDYGDIIVGQSAGSPARLAGGTDGQVLTMVSGLPDWETPGGGGADPWTYVYLASDHTNATTTLTDVPSLEVTPDDAGKWVIEGLMLVESTSINTVPRIACTNPDNSNGAWIAEVSQGATGGSPNYGSGGTGAVGAGNLTGVGTNRNANLPLLARMQALYISTAAATTPLKLQLSSEANSVTVTMLAGSYLRYRKLP